jgi:exosortase A
MIEGRLQVSSAADESLSSQWRLALPMLVGTLLAILVLYHETAMAIVEIWMRSETFAHGFLVPAITLWLIWRIRHTLVSLAPRPTIWAIVFLAVTGFVWLLAELATADVLSQFALVTMLVLAVPGILGLSVARRMAFPLAFLYFAVPFGEFALPQLMDWTANFTVLGLRLSGIPVYREGLNFVIPSGSWSVVEACSGVRYLIASLCVGTLFAYLNYHSLKRRLIFVAVSFVVPVIANWIRAYMIVMIGHFSGNKLAVGVDHLIYGWLFFGIVIMTMFWIGSRWREDEFVPAQEQPGGSSAVAGATLSPPIVALSAIVLATIWPLAQWQIEQSVPSDVSRIESLGPIAGWPPAPEINSGWTPHFESPAAVLHTTFGAEGRSAGLFLGYYRNQDSRHKLVSSSNTLVQRADLHWHRVAAGERAISVDQRSITVRAAELKSVDGFRLVVWQWYWINGHLTSSDFVAKAYTAWSRLMGQGDDSAVIIAYAPKEQVGGGEAALADFVIVARPDILSVLNRTRDLR